MKQTNQAGFTLIELLVVVLIIGILAAIALPAYQRAVMRSRFVRMLPGAKSMAQSNEVYYMEHGQYSNDSSQLDINGVENVTLVAGQDWNYALATDESLPNNRLVVYTNVSRYFPGEVHCEASTDKQARWLCKEGMNGTFVGPSSGGWNSYVIEGKGQGVARGWDTDSNGTITMADTTGLISWVISGQYGASEEMVYCMIEHQLVPGGDGMEFCGWTLSENTGG